MSTRRVVRSRADDMAEACYRTLLDELMRMGYPRWRAIALLANTPEALARPEPYGPRRRREAAR